MANGRMTLSRLADKLDALIALVTTHAEDDKRQFTEFHAMLLGRDETPGMKGRLDRLEQTEVNRRWHVRALWTALIGVAAAFVSKLLP